MEGLKVTVGRFTFCFLCYIAHRVMLKQKHPRTPRGGVRTHCKSSKRLWQQVEQTALPTDDSRLHMSRINRGLAWSSFAHVRNTAVGTCYKQPPPTGTVALALLPNVPHVKGTRCVKKERETRVLWVCYLRRVRTHLAPQKKACMNLRCCPCCTRKGARPKRHH